MTDKALREVTVRGMVTQQGWREWKLELFEGRSAPEQQVHITETYVDYYDRENPRVHAISCAVEDVPNIIKALQVMLK